MVGEGGRLVLDRSEIAEEVEKSGWPSGLDVGMGWRNVFSSSSSDDRTMDGQGVGGGENLGVDEMLGVEEDVGMGSR